MGRFYSKEMWSKEKMKYRIKKDLWGIGYYIMDENNVCMLYTFSFWGAKRAIKKALKLARIRK